jgi:acyl dehydratase
MPEVVAPSRTLAYADLADSLGTRFGPTPWTMVTQAQVDAFADVTHDHQWIHVDEERARTGPFGAPIAHGFLTLSLIPTFFASALDIPSRMSINYGLNRVRFTSPVPVGSRLRARIKLQACDTISDDGVQMTWLVTVEREGADKPACVAESLTRRYA